MRGNQLVRARTRKLTGRFSSSPTASRQARKGLDETAHELGVLLLDGETRQTLTCARTLGRAGIVVGVAAERRDTTPAMHSRWCTRTAILPALAGLPDAYVDELVAFLDRHPTGVVLPAYDGSIDAIRARRAERSKVGARSLSLRKVPSRSRSTKRGRWDWRAIWGSQRRAAQICDALATSSQRSRRSACRPC